MLNCKLYERCMRAVCMMITRCILYLEAPNAKIKLFTDKEVTNWINNKLKDRKYHEVLTLTLEEFDEQEQNKKKREEEVVKKQPKKGPEPKAGEEGECYTFIYSMPTACIQRADANTNVGEFLLVDPYKCKLSPADYKRCATLKNVYEAVAVQCGMYDSMEFEATKAYVTENGNFTIVPVSIYSMPTA